MKRLKVTTEEQANMIRKTLNEFAGWKGTTDQDDVVDPDNPATTEHTKHATGPAYPDSNGDLYLTVYDHWVERLVEEEKMPEGCEVVEWDSFVAPVVEDELSKKEAM